MELKRYFSLMLHWAWVLILGMVFGAGGGILASRYQSPIYQATTKILVIRPPQETSSDMTYQSDQVLLQTFIQFLTTQPVLDATSSQLGYKVDPKQIRIQQLPNTQILQLSIEDRSPQRSAEIANTLVNVSIKRFTDIQDTRYTSSEESIQAQLNNVESQMANLQAQISQISASQLKTEIEQVQTQITPLQNEASNLQQDIAKLNPAYTPEQKALIAEKQARLAEIQPLLSLYQQIYSNLVVLGKPIESVTNGNDNTTLAQTTLGLYQQIYTELLKSLESIRLARLESTSNVLQIEEGSVPIKPVRPNLLTNTLLAATVGLILSIGAVVLIEKLDDTLKAPEDIKRLLGLPVIGYIAEMQKPGKGQEKVFVAREPHSPISEGFRSLKANLEFIGRERSLKTILVTSSDQFEGKTTVAANLAVIIAQGGKRVLLLDADLRQPGLHQILNITNRSGLSNILSKDDNTDIISRTWNKLENMSVITSGQVPANPIELLDSEKMNLTLAKLEKSFDTIVIDSPPCLVADAQVLAGKVDGVLMIVQPGHTHKDLALAAIEQFNRAGAQVIGVVLNHLPRSRGYYGYYYGGYPGYPSISSNHKPNSQKSHHSAEAPKPTKEDKPQS